MLLRCTILHIFQSKSFVESAARDESKKKKGMKEGDEDEKE